MLENFVTIQNKKSKNKFVPLDSEHFSLFNSNITNVNIKKIYIKHQADHYFNKKINLSLVSKEKFYHILNGKWVIIILWTHQIYK